jgi:hypothetical protein
MNYTLPPEFAVDITFINQARLIGSLGGGPDPKTLTLAGLAIAIAVLAWWWVQHKGRPIAIAGLPLENVSHDPANDYFADGLTDQLIRNLSTSMGWWRAPGPRPLL